jgi:23S rRNA pseudouridine955/2504/2580 synthase
MREALHKYVTGSGERRVSVHEDGKAALTRVKVLKRGKFSLLEVRLLTGRTHQIRVHLAHAGYPVVGDEKYGDFALNKQLKQRLLLHAAKLSLQHPLTGERLKLESAMPAAMKALLQ